MRHVLAIDLGTGALKAAIYDDALTLVAEASAPISTRRDAGGMAEQDVGDWLTAMAHAGSTVVARAGIVPDAIAVTGHMSAPVLVDAQGCTLAPVRTLADATSAPHVETGPLTDEIARVTGNRDATHFGLAKLRHAITELPGRSHATALSPKDVLRLHLGGSRTSDATDAANWLLVDPATGDWHDDLVAASGVPAGVLPELLPCTATDGRLSAEWATQLGLPAGVALVVGASDMATALAASGCERQGTALVSLGTSATALAPVPAVVPELVGAMTHHRAADGGTFVLGSHFNGGACLDWFHRVCGTGPDRNDFLAQMSEAALAREAGRGGGGVPPAFTPHLMGSGTPDFDPTARASLIGLSIAHDRVDLFRAIIAGASGEIARSFECLERVGIDVRDARLGGGGSRLPYWRHHLRAAIAALGDDVIGDASSAKGGAALGLRALA